MPMLVIQKEDGSEEPFSIDKPEITIGRDHAPSGVHNDINLPDRIVSRRHARIFLAGGAYFVEDLGSENHVFVNEREVTRAALTHGDRIRIGQHSFVFQTKETKTADPECFGVGALDPCRTIDLNYLILHRLSSLLVTVTSVTEFLSAAMDLVMESINSTSGALLLLEPDGSLKEEVIRGMRTGWSADMVFEAVRTKKSILAGHDFAVTETMDIRGAKSSLCAPLIHEGQVLGVIYLEDPMPGRFTEDSLMLVTVIANQVASGLEKAALNERLYREILIRKNLERFLSPRVAERIVEDCTAQGKVALRTDKLTATILFADIQGFTLLSERLDADEVATLLTQYFTLMTNVVFKWEGTLDKYLGDGLLAIFGAPLPFADHAERAVGCALEMLKEQQKFVEELPPDRRFAIRIGINTGEVVAGYLGAPQRMEYTVLGEPVVIAFRLQSLAKPGSISMGRSTYELISDRHSVEYIDRIKTPKGQKLIEVYRLCPPG